MKIYDISRPLNKNTAIYKNRESMKFELPSKSEMRTNFHIGTHVDAPYHMQENGKKLGQLDLELFYGTCTVFDLTYLSDAIHRRYLEKLTLKQDDIVLFKTRNSYDDGWNPEFVYLAPDAALYLVEVGIKTVGLDAMSVERNSENHETHHILFDAGIGLIEDIRLAAVPAGNYILSALPLAMTEAEASPTRAVLIDSQKI
ncbi:MAG: cyclase family protein [Eubacteriales bacterium]|nr:cyclase family protein [Eubacteriales bacterium]